MPTDLVIVIGSATRPGRLHRALQGAASRARARDAATTTTIFDLGQVTVGPADGRPPAALGDDTERIVDAITAASAVLLATPTYRGSLTGTLKNLLDHLPVPSLQGKPTAIAAIGASDHHYLGADRHLRDILTFFGALVPPTSVYLTTRDFTDGAPSDDAAARLDALIATTLKLADAADDGQAFGPPPIGAGRG